MGIGQQGYLQTGLMRHLKVVGEFKKGKSTKGVRSNYNLGRSELFVNNEKKRKKKKKNMSRFYDVSGSH
jgi:hypothetical protein